MLLVDLREDRILGGTGDVRFAVNIVVAPAGPAPLGPIHEGVEAYRVTPPRDNVERLRTWERVAASPWVVIVDTPTHVVFDPIDRQAKQRVGIAAALAGVTLLVLFVGSRQFASRLRRLEGAAMEWASGNFDHRANLSGKTELDRLGATFDRMAESLREAERQIAGLHRNRGRLEGVHLTAVELAHLLNNDLMPLVGVLDLLPHHIVVPPDVAGLLGDARQNLERAVTHIAQFQRVVQVETKETPVGPALDLGRSIGSTEVTDPTDR